MIWFVDEEQDQIPASLGAPQGGIYILAAAMSFLDKTEHGASLKDLANFLAGNSVLDADLLDDRIQPDDSVYFYSH
jgi:hypothetical protein